MPEGAGDDLARVPGQGQVEGNGGHRHPGLRGAR